jgi:hypothetical protein
MTRANKQATNEVTYMNNSFLIHPAATNLVYFFIYLRAELDNRGQLQSQHK